MRAGSVETYMPGIQAKIVVALGLAALAGAACSPTPSEEAARNEVRDISGYPAGNTFPPTNVIETSSPEIANTAEASMLRSKAGAAGTQQECNAGFVKGEAATDTSGRASQERPDGR